MTILSGQSIRLLCTEVEPTMLEPFCERSVHEETGTTYGLSVAGYDVRIKDAVHLVSGQFSLAVTVEHFALPDHVLGVVHDKSTLARLGLTVQNTVIEPGWRGWLTLELANHGRDTIEIVAGQPIAQVIFHVLDAPAEKPYDGRYQDQGPEPQRALRLRGDEESY